MDAILTSVNVKPRLAFIGTGWIGLNRMQSLLQQDICNSVAILDPSVENAKKALGLAPHASVCQSWEEVLSHNPDGIVIATPSGLHAEQCITALNRGFPVFCQKPLGRTWEESEGIIDAARKANKLLGVDLSYRYTSGIKKIYELVRANELGNVFAVDLVFYNAYGPDKAWFYNYELSGGGCLIDLGIHLVDLALWILDFPEIRRVESSLIAQGKSLKKSGLKCTEDYVSAQLETETGMVIRLACSWNLPAGKDAEIKASFYGTKAAALFSNVNGSFYDFETMLCHRTSGRIISSYPDEWGGRALTEWTKRLQKDDIFNPEIIQYIKVAEVIDRIYGRIKC